MAQQRPTKLPALILHLIRIKAGKRPLLAGIVVALFSMVALGTIWAAVSMTCGSGCPSSKAASVEAEEASQWPCAKARAAQKAD